MIFTKYNSFKKYLTLGSKSVINYKISILISSKSIKISESFIYIDKLASKSILLKLNMILMTSNMIKMTSKYQHLQF